MPGTLRPALRARYPVPSTPRPEPCLCPEPAASRSRRGDLGVGKWGVPRPGGCSSWLLGQRSAGRAQIQPSWEATAARLGAGRPALLAPSPPLLAHSPALLPLSACVRSDRPPCPSFSSSPSLPTPLFPRLSSSTPLPPSLPFSPPLPSPPLWGGGASPLPPRQCCGCAFPPLPASRGAGCQRLFRAGGAGRG